MKAGANQARSDDTQKLKKILLYLLAREDDKSVVLYTCPELSWNNDVSGHHLCPPDRLDEYDLDPGK